MTFFIQFEPKKYLKKLIPQKVHTLHNNYVSSNIGIMITISVW